LVVSIGFSLISREKTITVNQKYDNYKTGRRSKKEIIKPMVFTRYLVDYVKETIRAISHHN